MKFEIVAGRDSEKEGRQEHGEGRDHVIRIGEARKRAALRVQVKLLRRQVQADPWSARNQIVA